MFSSDLWQEKTESLRDNKMARACSRLSSIAERVRAMIGSDVWREKTRGVYDDKMTRARSERFSIAARVR